MKIIKIEFDVFSSVFTKGELYFLYLFFLGKGIYLIQKEYVNNI